MLRRRAVRLIMMGLVALLAGTVGAIPAGAAPAGGEIRAADAPDAVAGSYIVVLKPQVTAAAAVADLAEDLAVSYGGRLRHTYTSVVRGFAVSMTAARARHLAADPAVAYVEQDRVVRVDGTQPTPPSWGLDRVDQANLPLDHSYTYPSTAAAVHGYVIDTGVMVGHTDFAGRASNGYDFVGNDAVAEDCNGHGTHVAGTVGGTRYGVAKQVRLVAVRVLDCAGAGTTARVMAGVDWVTRNAIRPAVANMSLGGTVSTTLEASIRASVAAGITYVVAAGNSNGNACGFTPARMPEAIAVAATDASDVRASFSNYGSCVDMFAPGMFITSDANTGTTATTTMSGTSMAAPHVTGAAALALQAHPGYTPAQVRTQLLADAATGRVANPGTGSPNLLLGVRAGATPASRTVNLRAQVNNRYVTAERAGAASLIANRAVVGAWEQFTLLTNGDGSVSLRAGVNGRYVAAESAGALPLIANRTAIGPWEKFTLVINGDGSVSLRARINNRYVAAESAGALPLIANRTAIGAWERFDLLG